MNISEKGFKRLAQMVEDKEYEERLNHFIKRTDMHISLVQKYCEKLEETWEGLEGLVERGLEHDSSKYEEDELEPYIWLTWRYKCQDDGVECNLPEGMEEAINKATEHHILNNKHHPECHQERTDNLINKNDRDAIPDELIDATKMSILDLAEMVADWCAMSEERGNTPEEWANKVVNIRWKFTDEQEDLIYKFIESVW